MADGTYSYSLRGGKIILIPDYENRCITVRHENAIIYIFGQPQGVMHRHVERIGFLVDGVDFKKHWEDLKARTPEMAKEFKCEIEVRDAVGVSVDTSADRA